MLRPSFDQNNAVRSGLTQVFRNIQRLIIACLCIENCRFCGKELALATSSSAKGKNTSSTGKPFHDFESIIHLPSHVLAETSSNEGTDCTDGTGRNDSSAKLLERQLTGLEPQLLQQNLARAPSEGPIPSPTAENSSKRLEKPHAIFGRLKEPWRAFLSEIEEIRLSATHADLVSPAFIHFARQPFVYPRMSECLCDLCWEEIDIDLPLLGFCPLPSGDQKTLPVASGVTYDGRVKELIRSFKYKGDATLAGDLACLMSLGWSALIDFMPASKIVLVPVPLHPQRKKARGYNQSELLARELSIIMSLPVTTRALKRNKATKSQQLLGRTERLENVRTAFKGDRRQIEGKTVVLIDDVCTSGSTLIACAEEALRCGALSVVALTIARAMLAHDR